jgi:hypothetical protein
MNLLDRIKKLLHGQAGDAEQVIRNATSTTDMLDQLDHLITQNEVELRKTRNELARLEMAESANVENIKAGRVGEREKEFVLLQIKRTRGQMESLKRKADILNKNIELHMNLVGKIQAMEAMDLRGIEQNMVERVMLDFEEGMEKFREAVQTGDGITKQKEEVLTARDKDELKKLEKEILGEAAPEKKQSDMDKELAELEAKLGRRMEKRAQPDTPHKEKEPEEQLE